MPHPDHVHQMLRDGAAINAMMAQRENPRGPIVLTVEEASVLKTAAQAWLAHLAHRRRGADQRPAIEAAINEVRRQFVTLQGATDAD